MQWCENGGEPLTSTLLFMFPSTVIDNPNISNRTCTSSLGDSWAQYFKTFRSRSGRARFCFAFQDHIYCIWQIMSSIGEIRQRHLILDAKNHSDPDETFLYWTQETWWRRPSVSWIIVLAVNILGSVNCNVWSESFYFYLYTPTVVDVRCMFVLILVFL